MNIELVLAWIVEDGIHWIFYLAAFAASLWLLTILLSEPLEMYIRDFKYKVQRVKEKQSGSLFDEEMNERDTLSEGNLKEIAKKLHATRKIDKQTNILKPPKSLQTFLIESIAIGVVGTTVSFIASNQVVLSLVIGLLFLTVPYMFLTLKVNNIRKKVGEDFLKFIQVFTQQYNANSNNIMAALRSTLTNIDSPEMRMLITRLYSEINQTREERGVRRAVNEFVYVSGTSWSKRLGSIIVRGYIDDYDVSEQLSFLEKQVMETEEMIEKESEGVLEVRNLAFFLPLVFIGTMIIGWQVAKVADFWYLQFGNTIPLLLLMFSVIGLFFSIIIGLLVTNTKNDI